MSENCKNDHDKIQEPENAGILEGAKDPAPAPDVVDTMEENCFEIAREYINALEDPEEMKTNNGLFVDMIKRIYRYYLGDIIGNKVYNGSFRYDYNVLDKCFKVYTSLVYKYKANKRPSMIEFSLFVNTSRQNLYNVAMGYHKQATPHDVDMVKSWYQECENQLTNGSSVFEIFLLKSQYRYNDNLAPLPIENQRGVLSVGELPDLQLQKIAKKDRNQEPNKGQKV